MHDFKNLTCYNHAKSTVGIGKQSESNSMIFGNFNGKIRNQTSKSDHEFEH